MTPLDTSILTDTSTIDSLPERPLAESEGTRLLEQTDERFVPDAYMAGHAENEISPGFVTALYLNVEDGTVVLLGYDPAASAWVRIRTDDEDTPIHETYDRLDAWCERFGGTRLDGSSPAPDSREEDSR